MSTSPICLGGHLLGSEPSSTADLARADVGLIVSLFPFSVRVALALALNKSKPVNLSLEDFFSQLRKHVRTGPPNSAVEKRDHFDSASFWKEAYEKSEAANAKLLDRIHELENNDRVNGDGKQVFKMPDPPNDGKRKRAIDASTKANSQSKRRAVAAKPAYPLDTAFEEIAEDVETPKVEVSAALIRCFFDLRQHIASTGSDGRALLVSLRCFCRAAVKLIAPTDVPIRSNRSAQATMAQRILWTDVESTAVAVQRTIPTVVQGLDRLCANPDTSSHFGSAVYDVVVLFEAVLSQLSSIALQNARESTNIVGKRVGPTKPKSRTVKKTAAVAVTNHHGACQGLAKLAACVMLSLDPLNNGHNQILEGCLCALLDHLGSSLSTAVFTDEQPVEQQSTFTGVVPPQGLQDLSDIDPRTAVQAVQMEAPYLVYILDKVMTFINVHQGVMTTESTPLFSLQKTTKTSRGAFAQKIKEKLQNTLLKGVFGDDDETFRDSLRRPPEAANDAVDEFSAQVGVCEGTPKWLTSELWRILGWDILTYDDSF